MMRVTKILLLTVLGFVQSVQSQTNYAQYVNPFIGSEGPYPGQAQGGGDIFIGGVRPFGMVKVGIDTTAVNLTTAVLNGGWTPDGNITAVSMYTLPTLPNKAKEGC